MLRHKFFSSNKDGLLQLWVNRPFSAKSQHHVTIRTKVATDTYTMLDCFYLHLKSITTIISAIRESLSLYIQVLNS